MVVPQPCRNCSGETFVWIGKSAVAGQDSPVWSGLMCVQCHTLIRVHARPVQINALEKSAEESLEDLIRSAHANSRRVFAGTPRKPQP
ncbi:MAG TPA: hypothetical protein PL053_11410 [Deltaproteobacteria bacterium]|nr:hypothetical protein [Deltaproteobacteria bacterium]